MIHEIASLRQTADPKILTALCRGTLDLGGVEVDCYVLDTEERVISSRAAVLALTGKDHGNLGKMLGAASLKPHLSKDLDLGNSLGFLVPGTQFVGRGITSGTFLAVCRAFANALASGELRRTAQQRVAWRCAVVLAGFAEVGLVALIDEATGYQRARSEVALREKMNRFVGDLRPWEPTFPDELWGQFARLTRRPPDALGRPRWWGKLVLELIYNPMDPDVTAYLRANKPPPRHGQNYHQWLTSDYGLSALHRQIGLVIGLAMASHDMRELQDRVAFQFGTRPVMPSMFWPSVAAA